MGWPRAALLGANDGILAGVAVAAAPARGPDREEAALRAVVLGAALPCRAFFDRPGGRPGTAADLGWAAAALAAPGLLVRLLLFACRGTEYDRDLWWQFAYDGDGPRALRARSPPARSCWSPA